MEASALHAPAAPLARLSISGPLLRLRSDEQLVASFRAGGDDAFRVLHDRYRQRLFSYVRQMLPASSRQDAEDVLQDVFLRAYRTLRADSREINVKAWLYRVAHNRCIDHLRKPSPAPAEIFETSRKPLQDPIEEAQRRDDLRRLVADVSQLAPQQRSALLMRELNGLSYQELAQALDVTVPAVKSLLVRARLGLVEASEARDADCCEIRRNLLDAHDRGVKAPGRARRHMRECPGCQEYRTALRGVRRSFAALMPGSAGFGAFAAKLVGLGGAGGSAAAGSALTAGTGTAGTALAGATACKVAAVVCTAALAGGAVEVTRLQQDRAEKAAASPAADGHGADRSARTAAAAAPVSSPSEWIVARTRLASAPPAAQSRPVPAATRGATPAHRAPRAGAAPVEQRSAPVATTAPVSEPEDEAFDGGVRAPDEAPAASPVAPVEPEPAASAEEDPPAPVAPPIATANSAPQASGAPVGGAEVPTGTAGALPESPTGP